MKLYIITIDEVYDYEGFHHAPKAFPSFEKAKEHFDELYKDARKELDWDSESRGERSFSLYPDGSWGRCHYDAIIDEVDMPDAAPQKKFRLDVIFGEQASKATRKGNPDKVRRDICAGKIEGACETYTFSTEEDRSTAIDLLDAADGWMGTFYQKIH